MEIRFTEGDLVKAGVPIALIDPRPYQAQLTQYEGTLEHDRALLDNARIDLTRYKTLIAQDSTSRQIYDTQVALVKQDEGTVKSDEGQIATIKLDLTYCNVVSPVTGRIGLRQVDLGNYVTPGDTNGIAVVSQISPISVVFTVPEDDIPTLVTATAGGKILPVEALDRAAQRHLATGNLSALDNQIDTTTGTVKLRSQFANDDASLFPNQFVNVKLPVQIFDNVLVVPTSAIEHGSNGTFVYVVGPAVAAPAPGADGAPAADAKPSAPDAAATPSGDKPSADQPAKPAFKVTMKAVTLGATEGERVLVQTGVEEGDEVVTDGADQLKDGQTVTVASSPAGSDDASASSTHHHKKKPASTTPGQARTPAPIDADLGED